MAQVLFTGNVRSAPAWAKDFGGREHILPIPGRIDPTLFADGSGVLVTTTALAAINATTIAVTALTSPAASIPTAITNTTILIPAGTVLAFAAGIYARLTADAVVGATSLAVEALPVAVPSGSTVRFSKYGVKFLPSGTLVSRTYAQRDASGLFHPAIYTEDEVFLTMFDLSDTALYAGEVEFYRPGGLVAENYLPDWTTISANANLLAKLRAVYQCIKGVD